MNLYTIKIWQWAIIGCFIGVILAYQHLRVLDAPDPNRAEVPVEQVEGLLQGTVEDQPQLDQIVVHPTTDGYRLQARQLSLCNLILTYSEITIDIPRSFHPRSAMRPQTKDLYFTEYLAWAAEHFPRIHYRYIWWEEPSWLFGSYALIATFVGAGIWPIAINLLSGGGPFYTKPREKVYKPLLIGGDDIEKGHPSDERDQHDWGALIATAESRLREQGFTVSATEGSIVDKNNVVIRALTGDHPQNLTQNIHSDDSLPEKTFGGAFYPTELHSDDTI